MSLKYSDIKDVADYLVKIKFNPDERKRLILLTVSFLMSKYPGSLIFMDIERELLEISEPHRENILKDLKEIGLVKI